MKITSIKAKNFLSYPELSHDFEDGLILIDGFNYDQNSANGSGKSTLIECITFALFGKSARDVKVDEHIMRGKSSMSVAITLIDGEQVIEIVRTRNPNTTSVSIDGASLTAQDLNDFQQKINKLLGCDYDLFLNSVYFAQNKSGQFLLASDENKKQILLDILNLDKFSQVYDKIREDLKKIESSLEKEKYRQESLLRDLSSHESRIKTYADMKDNFVIRKEERIKDATKETEEVVRSIETLKLSLNDVNYDADGYKSRHARYIKAVELNDKMKIASREQTKCHSEVSGLKEKIDSAKEKLRVFHTGICATCSQKLPPNSDLVCEETRNVSELRRSLETKSSLLTQLESFIALNGQAIEKELLDSKGELEKYTGLKSKVDLINKQLEDYYKRLKSLDALRETIAGEKNDYDMLLNQEVIASGGVKENLTKLSKNIDILESDSKYLEAAKDIFGPQGIRSVILDSSINNLNQLANNYLRELFDASAEIHFSMDKVETKTAYKQRVTVGLLFDGVPVNLDSLSGGEKRRVIIATDLALADLVGSRGSKSLEMAFLDEISEGLDTNGREKLFSLLKKLSETKMLLCVDHSSEYKQLFDRTVMIEKRNNESRII